MTGRGRYVDLTGKTFGNFVVIEAAGSKKTKNGALALWNCRCICGKEIILPSFTLRHQKSCGCLKGTHRHSANGIYSPTYSSWRNMISRCTHPSCPGFEHYKKRGITVSERWRTFENFLADLGEKPSSNYTLERINNDGNYEPGNCRWATRREQGNNRITNIMFEYRGQRYTMANLARITGASKETLRSRLCRSKLPWTVEGAVHTPLLPKTMTKAGFYC